jgi:hypothetical protein
VAGVDSAIDVSNAAQVARAARVEKRRQRRWWETGSRIAKEDGDQNKAATVLGSSDAEDGANTSKAQAQAQAKAEAEANRQL